MSPQCLVVFETDLWNARSTKGSCSVNAKHSFEDFWVKRDESSIGAVRERKYTRTTQGTVLKSS